MTSLIENLMYNISSIFLFPVLLLILLLFVYSLFAMGMFLAQTFVRRRHRDDMDRGYDIVGYSRANVVTDPDDLEIYAYKKLEYSSITTRVSPMLGLVATMIPMGPALKALANGNIQGISENLIIAFSAVIFSLITASITYWLTSVRKRWYAAEIRDILKEQQ